MLREVIFSIKAATPRMLRLPDDRVAQIAFRLPHRRNHARLQVVSGQATTCLAGNHRASGKDGSPLAIMHRVPSGAIWPEPQAAKDN